MEPEEEPPFEFEPEPLPELELPLLAPAEPELELELPLLALAELEPEEDPDEVEDAFLAAVVVAAGALASLLPSFAVDSASCALSPAVAA